jgi:two-component system phosphate regulon sensor histidine kinase PhoR
VETRFTVIDPKGTVLADSERSPEGMDDHAGRDEVVEALRTREAAWAKRYSRSVGTDMMYVALPVYHGERLLGIVRAALPLTVIEERGARLRAYVFLGALLAALMALVPGLYFARRVTEPLRSMTEAARALASGRYEEIRPLRGSKDEVGELAEAFGLMADELRARVHTIESARERLAAILSAMVEGVVAIDGEQRILHFNEVAGEILKVSPDQVGSRLSDVTELAEVREAFATTLREGERTRGEITVPALPYEQLIELQVAPLRGTDGVVGAVMVLHNVTQVRRLNAVRRDFVANVSHELKTPLTVITGLVETLLDDPDMPTPTRDRFLGKTLNQCNRLTTLVHDLLTLSRVETEEEALELRRLDLRGPVQESVRVLAGQAEEKGITLETSMPAESVLIRGDYEALRQVVDNLLSNAIRYTPSGGNVWVRLREDGGVALLEVQDTGLGLEPKHQARIFQRFYRVDKARSRELGGTGLGLSIVKHVVLAHKGGVAVESRPGHGSTFSVRVPLRVGEASSVEEAVA